MTMTIGTHVILTETGHKGVIVPTDKYQKSGNIVKVEFTWDCESLLEPHPYHYHYKKNQLEVDKQYYREERLKKLLDEV